MVSILESHLTPGHFFPEGFRASDVILPVSYESTLNLNNPIMVYRGENPLPRDFYDIPSSNIPDLFTSFYTHSDYDTQRKFDHFWDSCDVYNEQEKEYILRALMISTVGHQFNLDDKKRFRKADNSPYIFHPIEIALRFVKEGFDWITVTSSLLHDVPEDVNLGEGLKGRDNWLEIIRREFTDTGKGDLIAELVDGVTEKAMPEERRQEIRATSIYRMIRVFIERGGAKVRKKSDRSVSYPEKEAIDEVVFNLLSTFDAALRSPEHVRIFLLKLADVWHNFQTAELIKPVKILRGKIAAGLAEWMGWYSMRSDLIEALSEVADTTKPFAPSINTGDKYKPGKRDKDIENYLKDSKTVIPEILKKIGIFPRSLDFQITWPIIDSHDRLDRWYGTTLSHPEVIVEMDKGSLDIFIAESKLPEGRRRDYFHLLDNSQVSWGENWVRFQNIRERFGSFIASRLGRQRIDYKLKIGNFPGNLVRLESNEPKVKDFFNRDRQISWQDIPEAGIFNNLLLDRPEEWKTHLGALIAFLYDPNLSLILKDVEVAGLIYKGNLIFINGRTTFKNIYNLLGMPIQESVYDQYEGSQYEAVRIRNRRGEQLIKASLSLRSGFTYTTSRDFVNRIIEVVS